MKLVKNVPSGIKLAVFGSTYAMYALNSFDELKLNAYNFAMDAQSLEVDNILLHKYADNISEGATVIFCFAACVTYYRYSMVTDKSKYYHIFKPTEIPNYSTIDVLKRSLKPSTIKNKIREIILGTGDSTHCIAPEANFNTKEQREKNMQAMANGWINLFNLKDLRHEDKTPLNVRNMEFNTELLTSMLSFCKQKDWNPIFVIIPFSDELNTHFGDEFVENSLKTMIKKASRDYNIPLLDYRKDGRFQQDYSAFIDGGFRMGKYGSRKFTRILLSDLHNKGYKANNETLLK